MIDKLNNICKDLDRLYDANSGFCALIAYNLSKFFELNNIQYKTKTYYYDKECDCPYHYSLIVDNIEINKSDIKGYSKIYENKNSDYFLRIHNLLMYKASSYRKNKEQLIEKYIKDFIF